MASDAQPANTNVPAPTESLRDIVMKVDERVKKLTAGMQTEEKKTFAQDVIVKHIGQANYLKADDPVKLKALLEALNNMDKAS